MATCFTTTPGVDVITTTADIPALGSIASRHARSSSFSSCQVGTQSGTSRRCRTTTSWLNDDSAHPPLASITAPTLVIHGMADPMFPLAHGQALAEEIPGATLLQLAGAGHGTDSTDWDTIVPAIVHHTRLGGRR